MPASPFTPKPKIAVSACLTGAEVRYNGGHKASRLCNEVLGEYFDLVPVCPEVAIGLGVPRAPIRLVGDPAAPRAVGSRDPAQDLSAPLQAYGERMASELDAICGYIFMHKSPSCALERAKVYQANGYPAREGARGLYAAAFCRLRPDLPAEEDARLCDPVLRENFITRVYAYAQWQQLLADGLSRGALIAFHARYKYQLMANNPREYRTLGKLLGSMTRDDAPEVIGPRYFSQLMQALRRCASRGNHSNVLLHLSGYLRDALSDEDRREIRQLIDQYQAGVVPLVVPLTLLKHHLRSHPDPYVLQQVYLQPHPERLGLRNAI
ncbi:YbgA family protein [Pseudomonas sp. NPDC090755]|uniref:YbgA family protein n=1 Tax=Pseudomonas sp. NPDC090755 TaxID=3364481 RepID=UPI00383BD7B1